GSRLKGGEAGPGSGLGEALAPEALAGEDAAQVKGLLRLGATGDERRARVHEGDVGRVDVVRRAGPRELLVPDHLLEAREAEAAVCLRPGDTRPAVIEEPALPVTVEPRRGRAVRRSRRGRDVPAEPPPGPPPRVQLPPGGL